MSSTPEAAVAAYFDALNRADSEVLTSLFDVLRHDDERCLITHAMDNSAPSGAWAQ